MIIFPAWADYPEKFMVTFSEEASRQFIDGPSGQLEIMTLAPAQAKNTVAIICHPHPLYQGTMNNKVVYTIAKAFDDLGVKTVRFNYRGVGKSDGKYGNGVGESEDLQAVIKQAKLVLPADDIILAGFSFGTFVAANVANQLSEIKGLLTVAPSVEHFDFSTMTSIACPWLIVQGENDEVVSPQAVYDFAKQNEGRAELVKIKDCSHFFHGRLTVLRRIIVNRFNTVVNL